MSSVLEEVLKRNNNTENYLFNKNTSIKEFKLLLEWLMSEHQKGVSCLFLETNTLKQNHYEAHVRIQIVLFRGSPTLPMSFLVDTPKSGPSSANDGSTLNAGLVAL